MINRKGFREAGYNRGGKEMKNSKRTVSVNSSQLTNENGGVWFFCENLSATLGLVLPTPAPLYRNDCTLIITVNLSLISIYRAIKHGLVSAGSLSRCRTSSNCFMYWHQWHHDTQKVCFLSDTCPLKTVTCPYRRHLFYMWFFFIF